MKKELIKELKGLRKRIELMPKSKKRDILFDDYYRYVSFLRDLKIIGNDGEFYEFNGDEDSANLKIVQKRLNEMIEMVDNTPLLGDIIEKIIEVYHENNYYADSTYKDMKIDTRDINRILIDYFRFLDDDILKIYNRLVNEECIYLAPLSNAGGETCFRTFDKLSNIIVNGKGNDLYDYLALAHEVGHAYQKYLERNNTNLHGFQYGIEITSMLFEKLFIKYLEDNYLFKDQVTAINEWELANNLNTLVHCKLISDVLKEDGSYVDFNDYSVHCNLSEEEIISKLEEDCGYVFDDRKELDLINYTYAIGDIMSSYFYYKILDNRKDGIKEFKNFISAIYNMPIGEFIDTYMNDTKYVKKYINEKIGEYHKKLIKRH